MVSPRRLFGSTLLAAVLFVEGHGWAEHRRPSTTVAFPYEQQRLLSSRNPDGAYAYVTSGATYGAKLPVVVFLHGMNPDGTMHPWFGPPYGDLRPVVESLVASDKVTPFVLAAPTHTRNATGAAAMWPRFDLGGFLDATQAAVGDIAALDRSRVIVIGYSAAGCNPTAGLFSESVRRANPVALVDVDGCVDESIISVLTERSAKTRVQFLWQRTWMRPVRDLEISCDACKIEEVGEFAPNATPHLAILPESFRRVLPRLLPR